MTALTSFSRRNASAAKASSTSRRHTHLLGGHRRSSPGRWRGPRRGGWAIEPRRPPRAGPIANRGVTSAVDRTLHAGPWNRFRSLFESLCAGYNTTDRQVRLQLASHNAAKPRTRVRGFAAGWGGRSRGPRIFTTSKRIGGQTERVCPRIYFRSEDGTLAPIRYSSERETPLQPAVGALRAEQVPPGF